MHSTGASGVARSLDSASVLAKAIWTTWSACGTGLNKFFIEGDLQGTMDKQKPTPGPWKAIPRKDCGVFRLYAGDEHLASLSFVDEATEDANADLMAAAPDLLRTIRELVELGGPDQDDQFTREGVRAFRDAEALLEKHGG
jgi:hypothetical protein